MYLIVCYDVPSNARRARLHKALQGFLVHVQKSVFEGKLPDTRYDKLKSKVLKLIDPTEDTVRIYHLCQRCHPATELLGTSCTAVTERDVVV